MKDRSTLSKSLLAFMMGLSEQLPPARYGRWRIRFGDYGTFWASAASRMSRRCQEVDRESGDNFTRSETREA